MMLAFFKKDVRYEDFKLDGKKRKLSSENMDLNIPKMRKYLTASNLNII